MSRLLTLVVLAACRRVPPELDEAGVPTSDCVPTTETCNAIDDDCDGEVDEDAADAVSGYVDADGDGYGGDAVIGCGALAMGGDCDDADPRVNPGAAESVDGRDENCDGQVDEGTPAADDDGDGWSEDDGDCDDLDAGIHPDTIETANGLDDDCDGDVDEGTADVDADGWSEAAGDCDDLDPAVHPGAAELCGDADLDCDGADPAGTAQFVATDGTRTDLSASLAGSSSALAEVALDTDGTLYVCAGTWYPALTITGSVHIEGRGEPVFSGARRGTPVTSTGPTLAVQGVTFEDGDGQEGGCLSHIGDSLALDAVTFSGCTAVTNGGAVWAQTGSVSVNASLFDDNEVFRGEPGGGGMWVSGTTLDLVDTTFSGNHTGRGPTYTHAGGLYFLGTTLNITGCTFSANEVNAPLDSLAFGGALSTDAAVVVESSTFTDNESAASGWSGGAGALNVGSLTMRNSTVSNNRARGSNGFGGAIVGNNMVFEDSTIASNTAAYMGGAIFTTSTLTFTGCEITDNAGRVGGAVYNSATTLLTSSVSLGNEANGHAYYSTGSCSTTRTDDQGGAPNAVSLDGCESSMTF